MLEVNRRSFLRLIGIGGAGLAAATLIPSFLKPEPRLEGTPDTMGDGLYGIDAQDVYGAELRVLGRRFGSLPRGPDGAYLVSRKLFAPISVRNDDTLVVTWTLRVL